MIIDAFIITLVGMGAVFIFILLMIVTCESVGKILAHFPDVPVHKDEKKKTDPHHEHVHKAIAILLAHKKHKRN